MRKFYLQKQNINRRSMMMMGIQGLAFSVLGARLFYLQSIKKEVYTTLSDKNRLRVQLLPPSRGVIRESTGKKLSYNRRSFRVYIIKENTANLIASLLKLKKVINLSEYDIEQTLKRAKYRHSYTPILVRENLNWDEMAKISVRKVYLKGVEIMAGESREYPSKNAYAHIIGYVGKVSRGDVKNDADPLLDLPGFEIGKNGVEKTYEAVLRGKAGTQQVEVNVKGRHIKSLEGEPPITGEDVVLSIDDRLQKYAMRILEPYRSASMIVMDANTGAIKAMVSQPSFDPNLFVGGISHKDWNVIRDNPYRPLMNKSISGQYAPGSLFKMIVALSALSVNVRPNHSVYCKGYTEIGSHKFHCWKKTGHGKVDLSKSLRESCDIWYYETSLQVGINTIAKTARKFGLGKIFDLGLPTQKKGIVPDKAWKKNRYGKDWYIGETVIASIGQGYVLATPLQLAVMTSRIATGKEVVPFISVYDENHVLRNTQYKKIDVPKKHLDYVRKSMYEVVNHYRGSAKRARPNHWIMAGKTGTAQVRTISQAERDSEEGVIKNKNLKWKYRDHALFTGYAPFDNPKYVVVAVVEHGGSGASTSAPLVKKMFDKISSIYDPKPKPKAKHKTEESFF